MTAISILAFAAAAGLLTAAGAPALAQAVPSAVAPAPTPPTMQIRQADLFGDYFAADPAQASAGAVIVLGGSEGGLNGSRGLARRLAAAGFDAIAVSYFGEAGQNPRLDMIPIEPVARAREWLEARPGGHGRIAVVGVSKGAELALLTASRDPGIRAVVVGVPSDVVWQGIDQTGAATGSSWTVDDRPLPYVHYDMSHGFRGLLALYQDSLAAAPVDPAVRIPVERINGPVLMISGDADTMWPSWEMANRIEARLKAAGFGHPVTNLVYPGAGHAVFGGPVAADTPGLRNALYVGGTIEGLVAARADGWPRVLAFLHTALDAAD